MIDQARAWWNEHQSTIVSSTVKVLGIVEKGLDGLPASGVPKTIIGGVKEMLMAVQVRVSPGHLSLIYNHELQAMQENNESIEDIVKKVEDIAESVAQLTVGSPHSASAAATSPDVMGSTERFNRHILSLCCTR
jgi:hypothetical protein